MFVCVYWCGCDALCCGQKINTKNDQVGIILSSYVGDRIKLGPIKLNTIQVFINSASTEKNV